MDVKVYTGPKMPMATMGRTPEGQKTRRRCQRGKRHYRMYRDHKLNHRHYCFAKLFGNENQLILK